MTCLAKLLDFVSTFKGTSAVSVVGVDKLKLTSFVVLLLVIAYDRSWLGSIIDQGAQYHASV